MWPKNGKKDSRVPSSVENQKIVRYDILPREENDYLVALL